MCTVCYTNIDIQNKLFSGLSDRLNSFVDKLSNIGKTKKKLSPGYFKEVAKAFLSGVEKPHKVESNYLVRDMAKQSYMEANIFRFSCAKSTSMVMDINDILRTQTKSSDFREFKKALDELKINYNKNWLETEYQLTQSVSRNSARHLKFLDNYDVTQYVKYKTIKDDRVRDWHKVLHNKIVRINSAEYDLIFPPNGWRCRCEFVAVTPTGDDYKNMISEKEIIDSLKAVNVTSQQTAYQYMVENSFDKNKAKTGVIFDENRMYIKSFNEAGLKYSDYDLENYQQFKNANPRIRNYGEETANFKYDYRDNLIQTNYLKYNHDTLVNPFEVWSIYDEDTDVYTKKYIGYNEVITIDLTTDKEVITKVEELDDNQINKVRKGVLIHG